MEKLAVINGIGVELEVQGADQVTCTSLSVAEVFNKNHKNIIRKINEFPKDNFTKLNFEPSKYIDSTGRILPCYKITRDGFSLLVMGFTGEKAYKWKLAFINAFNEMEKRLKNIKAEQMQKLAFRQSLGYKSQLKQQKLKYENEIKALKYDLEHKNELSLKRKLSNEELLELRKILARDYDILCMKEWEFSLFAESISRKNYKLDKANGFCIYKSIEEKFNSRLDYYKHYDEYEEKWGNLLRR
ncbi:Rha family transcriptional regulator [Campylobacter jejuni]|uniref:Rha family transcriptional regulator n=1 Tax=Campylobacter jejuni TaxID=197 RepID=UPI00069B85A1|nr:Rha family transcriptional regulator [Campylobacter jejuni]HEF3759446.1 Rha family transcriptional regulator [Campylobacter jejuni]HEF7280814.1 Rha family transcriptional regulator [Campylobacter jejuni]HEG7017090.1 Rha family transcriptional regulator [Campylobacter jejuni]